MLRIAVAELKKHNWILAGLAFSILWASASTATKIGLESAQPLVIAIVRFGIAALLMLFFSHIVTGRRLPAGKEWRRLTIYGILNITVYLGCYVIAMQQVTAGIGALAVATNPVFISFLSVFFLKKKLTYPVFFAILISAAGVLCASWPLLGLAGVTTEGLIILLVSMASYSVAAIYFSANNWQDLDLFTINGWQTLIGALFLLPFTLFFYEDTSNNFSSSFWSTVIWLAVPVSIVAVQLWMWLLKTNTVKAGLWLFLCPVFGFSIAALVMNDSLSLYTFAGIILVLTGLFMTRKKP